MIRFLVGFDDSPQRETIPHTVTLRGIEAGGIWIESEELNAKHFDPEHVGSVYFFPYSQIAYAQVLAVDADYLKTLKPD
ncbi:MAG: hypothetical protein A3J28_11180 [Acidobacteria bacterium RIFCSPLOWO2_12_FULL_60_22]|nr:MAG: hypothetical protein A3J28_11180 [Acidobacteria bacterium RIFCSPLOWO2_12_FULL_60_22]